MQKIHHLFVIDPVGSLNIKLDSSLRIASALHKMDHSVWICSPHQIEWHSQEEGAACLAQELYFPGDGLNDITIGIQKTIPLKHFRTIHMRKDPPYDMAYITCTWLLESAEKKGVKIFNSPRALRDLNEKMSIFQYPDFIRNGLVSAQVSQLTEFLDNKAHGDAILKPLTLHGGRGVIRLNREELNPQQIDQTLTEETRHGLDHRLIQPFDKKIFEGEVRAFTANGQPLAWCLKRPLGKNFLANTSSGATLENYSPSEAEKYMVQWIASDLLKKGVFFAGFDIIGGCVSEVNITSPRLLQAPNDTRDYYQEIASLISASLN